MPWLTECGPRGIFGEALPERMRAAVGANIRNRRRQNRTMVLERQHPAANDGYDQAQEVSLQQPPSGRQVMAGMNTREGIRRPSTVE